MVFDFVGLLVVAIARNLYTGDPYEGVRSSPPQRKNPKYGPDSVHILLLTDQIKGFVITLKHLGRPVVSVRRICIVCCKPDLTML